MATEQASLGTRLRSFAFRDARTSQISLIFLALVIGAVSGHAAVAMYLAIDVLLTLFFGESEAQLASGVRDLPWWHILAVPVLAGVAVGQIQRLISTGRAGGVPDVIEAAALKGGRMSIKDGLLSAASTVTALAGGSSTGREGPVVHLGASLSGSLAARMSLSPQVARTFLGCSVAAAVAASFNAPFAGVFFALEVIIGHYALQAFAPIVIAAIAGTLTSRAYFGDFPAFTISDYTIASPLEFPAFLLLGVLSALLAALFIRGHGTLDQLRARYFGYLPDSALPIVGGLSVGLIALAYPEVLSVGYEATSLAISGSYDLSLMLALIVAKLTAMLFCTVFRFGGGVFSPSLFLGAMLGGSVGLLAAMIFPSLASHHGVYAVAGMGAMASAILGAPISTILIVFEITGDYSITIAVMVASAIASMTGHFLGTDSFFHFLLARRGCRLDGGRATYLLKSARIQDHMDRDFFTVRENEPIKLARSLLLAQDGGLIIVTDQTGKMVGTLSLSCFSDNVFDDETAENTLCGEMARKSPSSVRADETLEIALSKLSGSGEPVLPVLSSVQDQVVIGLIRHVTVMSEYNKALLESQGRDL